MPAFRLTVKIMTEQNHNSLTRRRVKTLAETETAQIIKTVARFPFFLIALYKCKDYNIANVATRRIWIHQKERVSAATPLLKVQEPSPMEMTVPSTLNVWKALRFHVHATCNLRVHLFERWHDTTSITLIYVPWCPSVYNRDKNRMYVHGLRVHSLLFHLRKPYDIYFPIE